VIYSLTLSVYMIH